MKLKKIVSLALAGILAVSMLTACGNNNNSSNQPEQPEEPAATTGLSAQLQDELKPSATWKIQLADSSELNDALNHAIGNIGDKTISTSFVSAFMNGKVQYMGRGKVPAGFVAVDVLEDDLDVEIPAKATLADTIDDLDPNNIADNKGFYDKDNVDLVLLFAVDSGVEMKSIIEQIADQLDPCVTDLVTSYKSAANGTTNMNYHYTGSVASTSKTFVDADTTYGVTFVAVQITRVIG